MLKPKGARLYYAHSIQVYGSLAERQDVAALTAMGCYLCNPRWIAPDKGGDIMLPYMRAIDTCDAVIVRELNLHVGRGVYVEVKHALAWKKPVFVLRKDTINYVTDQLVVDDRDWKTYYGQLVAETLDPGWTDAYRESAQYIDIDEVNR